MSEKLHWFSLSFNNGKAIASVYRGVSKEQGRRLRVSDLDAAKELTGLDGDAALINSTYMGLWTEEEISK